MSEGSDGGTAVESDKEEELSMPKNETPDALFDIDHVTKRIVEFSNSPEFRELDAFYRRKSNFEILGIQRNETRHSRFLAWLLDPSGSHGLGTFGLKKFLEVCVISQLESKQRPPPGVLAELLDGLIVERAFIEKVLVRTELPLDKRARIDIHVACLVSAPGKPPQRLVIVIENKVASAEHDSQTVRYAEWLREHRADYDHSLLIYLTPVPTLELNEYEEPDCECKDFLHINYQYLVDYLIEPALTLVQPGIVHDFIFDYLRALSVPSFNVDNEDNNKGDLVMAISEHERNLLTAFYEKHQVLINAAVYAISIDPNQPEERRKAAGTYVREASTKDFSPYIVMLDGNIVVKNARKTAIGREVARVLIEEARITKDEFEKLKEDKSSSFPLMKQESEITEMERKYHRYHVGLEAPLTFQGAKYYASGNWGETNIPKFQKFLAQHFPRVQLRKQDAQPEGAEDAQPAST